MGCDKDEKAHLAFWSFHFLVYWDILMSIIEGNVARFTWDGHNCRRLGATVGNFFRKKAIELHFFSVQKIIQISVSANVVKS